MKPFSGPIPLSDPGQLESFRGLGDPPLPPQNASPQPVTAAAHLRDSQKKPVALSGDAQVPFAGHDSVPCSESQTYPSVRKTRGTSRRLSPKAASKPVRSPSLSAVNSSVVQAVERSKQSCLASGTSPDGVTSSARGFPMSAEMPSRMHNETSLQPCVRNPEGSRDRSKVQKGDWVVLVASDGKRVLGRVTDGSTARIGRSKRDISIIEGATWGTLFACERNGLRPCTDFVLDLPVAAEVGAEPGVDNRQLRDCNENQLLSEREIARMKKAGVSGAALVNEVVANSSTFSGKTQFSQEKYVKRKRQKFDVRVRAERPTAFTLCETYFQRSPEKILNMRWDSLAQLVAYGGVVPNRHILVAENCIGLVTGTLAERIRGRGRIVNLFGGSTPPGIELIRMLNLSEASYEAIVHAPIGILEELDIVEKADDEHIRYSAREEGEAETVMHATSAKRAEAIARRPKRGLVKTWFKDGFGCLIIAVRYETVELFDKLVKFLAPSGTFAVYCSFYQEAAELQRALQLSKLVVRVELTEMSVIHHQMLPGRSHPVMTDSATGGYVVSGIRIELPPSSILSRGFEEDT